MERTLPHRRKGNSYPEGAGRFRQGRSVTFARLYQINVTVPASLADDGYPVTPEVEAARTITACQTFDAKNGGGPNLPNLAQSEGSFRVSERLNR